MAVSLQELKKAIDTLEQAIALYSHATPGTPEQKAFRDACIQRFEYGVELSWKVAMKAFGSMTAAAIPAIREMARDNLIDDPQIWFDFVEARNNSSHSYDENVAQKVFAVAIRLPSEARKLTAKLELK